MTNKNQETAMIENQYGLRTDYKKRLRCLIDIFASASFFFLAGYLYVPEFYKTTRWEDKTVLSVLLFICLALFAFIIIMNRYRTAQPLLIIKNGGFEITGHLLIQPLVMIKEDGSAKTARKKSFFKFDDIEAIYNECKYKAKNSEKIITIVLKMNNEHIKEWLINLKFLDRRDEAVMELQRHVQ